MASDLLNDKAIRAALKHATDTGKPERLTGGKGLFLERWLRSSEHDPQRDKWIGCGLISF
jgi:hypothetical protein